MTNLSPESILIDILSGKLGEPGTNTYIILGKSGPTGKTWLWNELRKYGFKAFEITEDILRYGVKFEDNKNHCIVGLEHVTIILNEKLF